MDDDSPGSPPRQGGPAETKDIRLPYHKAEVSHIAVDVSSRRYMKLQAF